MGSRPNRDTNQSCREILHHASSMGMGIGDRALFAATARQGWACQDRGTGTVTTYGGNCRYGRTNSSTAPTMHSSAGGLFQGASHGAQAPCRHWTTSSLKKRKRNIRSWMLLAGGWLGLAVGTIGRQHNHGDQGPMQNYPAIFCKFLHTKAHRTALRLHSGGVASSMSTKQCQTPDARPLDNRMPNKKRKNKTKNNKATKLDWLIENWLSLGSSVSPCRGLGLGRPDNRPEQFSHYSTGQ